MFSIIIIFALKVRESLLEMLPRMLLSWIKSGSCTTIDKNDVLEFLTYRQVLKKVRFCCLKLFRSRHNTNFGKWITFLFFFGLECLCCTNLVLGNKCFHDFNKFIKVFNFDVFIKSTNNACTSFNDT